MDQFKVDNPLQMIEMVFSFSTFWEQRKTQSIAKIKWPPHIFPTSPNSDHCIVKHAESSAWKLQINWEFYV